MEPEFVSPRTLISTEMDIDLSDPTKDYLSRNYLKQYFVPSDIEDKFTVLRHTNRVCLICLHPSHPAFSKGIAKISSDFVEKLKTKNSVHSKSKPIFVQEKTCIATLECSDGTNYNVQSSIEGKLLEINESVLQDPTKLKTAGYGYIAIVLPKLSK